jgi:hypothetical protein
MLCEIVGSQDCKSQARLCNPKMSTLMQKHHPYTGNLYSEMSGDSEKALLHCGHVSAHVKLAMCTEVQVLKDNNSSRSSQLWQSKAAHSNQPINQSTFLSWDLSGQSRSYGLGVNKHSALSVKMQQ